MSSDPFAAFRAAMAPRKSVQRAPPVQSVAPCDADVRTVAASVCSADDTGSAWGATPAKSRDPWTKPTTGHLQSPPPSTVNPIPQQVPPPRAPSIASSTTMSATTTVLQQQPQAVPAPATTYIIVSYNGQQHVVTQQQLGWGAYQIPQTAIQQQPQQQVVQAVMVPATPPQQYHYYQHRAYTQPQASPVTTAQLAATNTYADAARRQNAQAPPPAPASYNYTLCRAK